MKASAFAIPRVKMSRPAMESALRLDRTRATSAEEISGLGEQAEASRTTNARSARDFMLGPKVGCDSNLVPPVGGASARTDEEGRKGRARKETDPLPPILLNRGLSIATDVRSAPCSPLGQSVHPHVLNVEIVSPHSQHKIGTDLCHAEVGRQLDCT